MTQLNLPLAVEFPDGSLMRTFFSTRKGDVASLKKREVVWVVELLGDNGWAPSYHSGFLTRSEARQFARERRSYGWNTRVVPYKACVDTKVRVNRQAASERLDY